MTKVVILIAILAIAINCHGHHDHDHHDHGQQHNHQHTHTHVQALTDSNFQDVLDKSPLLFVKFFAPWCGHCVRLAPAYEQIAHQLAHSGQDEYVIANVDCTVQKETCNKHQIRGYPTLKYFIDGEAHQYTGARTKEAIIQWLKSKPSEVRNSKTQEEL